MNRIILLIQLLFFPHLGWTQKIIQMGEGLKTQGFVKTIDANSSNTKIVIGGIFDAAEGLKANNIAIRDNLVWNNMKGGVDGEVYDVISTNNFTYAVGNFHHAGGKAIDYIAKWNGQNWSAMCSIPPSSNVIAIENYNSALYAIGYFTSIDGINASYIAKYENNQWKSIGLGFDTPPNQMIVCGGKLYISGGFTMFNGDSVRSVAWIDSSGTTGGLDLATAAQANYSQNIYNHNDSLGIVGFYNLFKYDGVNFNSILSIHLKIEKAFTYNNSVFVVYDSTKNVTNGSDIRNVKIRKLLNDSTLGYQLFYTDDSNTYSTYFSPEVSAINVQGSSIYIGGNFRNVNNKLHPTSVHYNGISMESLGKCAKAYVEPGQYALALCSYVDTSSAGKYIYVGGDFIFADNQLSPFIAKWDGTTWSCPGDGFDNVVRALTTYNGDIYASGEFQNSGISPTNHVAILLGNTWAPLSNGANGIVNRMLVKSGKLYLAGDFMQAGGVYSPYVIAYDGTNFLPLLTNNINEKIYDMVLYRDTIYLANTEGLFRSSNQNSWFVKIWNSSPSYALAVYKDTLIIGIETYLCFRCNNSFTCQNPFQAVSGSWYSPLIIGDDLFAYNSQIGFKHYTNGAWEYLNYYMHPYTSSRIDSTHVLIGGFMPELYTYNGIVYQNSVAILEYEPPTANFSRNLDSICEFKYAIYFSDYFDLLGKLVWNFPGGTPTFSVKQNPYVQYTSAGTYGASCTLTNPAGTNTYFLPDSIIVYPCVTGINDPHLKTKSISAYPNPNNGTFNLSNPHVESFNISIFDGVGKTIYKTTIQGSSTITIDENNLDAGIYFIGCQNAKTSQIIKIIKQ